MEENRVEMGDIQDEKSVDGITRLTVARFKSIRHEQSIEIRPLTILAGANSSGKSSIMQPLLLLKQTLEAPYDPGALLLNGPNVQFTWVKQLLSRVADEEPVDGFHVGVEVGAKMALTTYFARGMKKGLEVIQTTYASNAESGNLYREMSQEEMHMLLKRHLKNLGDIPDDELAKVIRNLIEHTEHQMVLKRNRCFLTLTAQSQEATLFGMPFYSDLVKRYINRIIHLPGLRGNPERTYPITAVGSAFPGTFEKYVASIIGQWQAENDEAKLIPINRDLTRLGLASGVRAMPINDTQVELLVKLLPQHKMEDMVSIADVGLGVSQTLPVIVALHAAEPGQLIYLEQPELHLHPRAQSAMAEVLTDAALQGNRLVVETHSSLLLLGIQTLVAEGKLPPEIVKLHWFKLRDDGSTQIVSADLDKAGAFGDWPEDFAQVVMDSENRYLDAAEAKLRGN